jgi:hypothetical protein
MLVTLHSILVCCALISDSFLNQCNALGVCVFTCVCLYVDVGSSELSFNLLALCLQCVCLFIYITINTNVLEKLLGIEVISVI